MENGNQVPAWLKKWIVLTAEFLQFEESLMPKLFKESKIKKLKELN